MHDHLLKEKLSLHVKIKKAEELLSEYTYDEDNINPDLSDYLVEKAEHIYPIPAKENFIINIHTEDTSVRLPEITRRIHRHFHDEYDSAKRKLQYNIYLGIAMLLLGLISLSVYFLIDRFLHNFFLIKIIEIFTWVFIWGAVEVLIIDRHDLKHDCLLMRRLAYADVVISYDSKMIKPIYVG